jgi:hypothetical protein
VFPFGAGGDIEYNVVADKSTSSFLAWMLLRNPVGVAVFEEVLFRGCLQAVAVRAFGEAQGIAFSAMTFVLWHVVINYKTVQATNAGDELAVASMAHMASFWGLFTGGIIFGLLRQRTGNLAAPIAFHWLIVLAMNTTLFVLSR